MIDSADRERIERALAETGIEKTSDRCRLGFFYAAMALGTVFLEYDATFDLYQYIERVKGMMGKRDIFTTQENEPPISER